MIWGGLPCVSTPVGPDRVPWRTSFSPCWTWSPICILAAATYAVFSWLDSNASDEVTNVISSWLRGDLRDKPHLGNLMIGAFDRIYTSPLLTVRAFRRSAAISSAIWLLVYFVPRLVEVDRARLEARANARMRHKTTSRGETAGRIELWHPR